MGNSHVPFIGHAPLPLDCQDLSQFEWLENEFSTEPNPQNTADRQPRQTYASRFVTGVEKRAQAPKPGARARDTRVRAEALSGSLIHAGAELLAADKE